ESLLGLAFHDHQTFDEQIRAEAAIQLYSLVDHRYGLLALHAQSEFLQFIRKASFVGRFEQSRAESTVHLHGGADDRVREVVYLHSSLHRIKRRLRGLSRIRLRESA